MNEIDHSGLIEERGPFQVIAREFKHDKFGMQLIGDTVIRPDGSEGQFFWVNFPREAVLIFPLDNEGNIYLTNEYTYATNKDSIEVAGGSPNENESIEEAAKREVQEELGLVVESLGNLGTTSEITSRVNNVTHKFLAKVKSAGEATLEPGEIIRLKKVPFEDAYKMVLNNEISTSSVSDGILKIKLFLQSLSELGK